MTDKKSTLDYIKDAGSIIVMAAILFFILTIVILLFYRLFFIYRYKKSDEQGRYQIEVERVLRILMLLGIKKDDSETIEELSRRVREELNLEDTFSFWEEYESFVYGDTPADIKMLQGIIEDKKILLQILKERCKIKYWIERCRRFV